MTIVNEIRNHGYITQVLNKVLVGKQQEKICVFMFFVELYYSLKNSDNAVKTIEMTIAAANYIRQYQLNFN